MITSSILGAAGAAVLLAIGGPGAGSNARPASAGPLDSLIITYDVAGLKVIHRPASATDVVAVNLYLLGGSRQVTASTAGIEPFLLTASEYGTQRYPGDATRRALGLTGSWITVSSTADYTRFSFRGVKQDFDSTWAVFADRLLHPTLDSSAMAITRGQFMTSIKSETSSPDGHVGVIADSMAFESHPYALPSQGTLASIGGLTAADLKKYHAEQMVTSRMLLVVVGDIPRARLEELINSTLGTLPRGSYVWTQAPLWPAKATRVTVVARKIPTNYILGWFSGPLQSSEDYPAFSLAVGSLGGLMSELIRGDGLSYSAGAPLLPYGATGGGVYVSTVRPDTVAKLINRAIEIIKAEPLPRSSLVKYAKRHINRYYYETESNAELADVLAMSQLYRGDYRAAANYADVLRKVSGVDIKRVARTYIKNIQYAYIGDTTRAPVKTMLKP